MTGGIESLSNLGFSSELALKLWAPRVSCLRGDSTDVELLGVASGGKSNWEELDCISPPSS